MASVRIVSVLLASQLVAHFAGETGGEMYAQWDGIRWRSSIPLAAP